MSGHIGIRGLRPVAAHERASRPVAGDLCVAREVGRDPARRLHAGRVDPALERVDLELSRHELVRRGPAARRVADEHQYEGDEAQGRDQLAPAPPWVRQRERRSHARKQVLVRKQAPKQFGTVGGEQPDPEDSEEPKAEDRESSVSEHPGCGARQRTLQRPRGPPSCRYRRRSLRWSPDSRQHPRPGLCR